MAIKKLGKAAAALALVVGLTAGMAGAASADVGDNFVAWNGVHGLDSIVEYAPGQDPYLHWILTPGGRSNVTDATLWIGDDDYSYTKLTNGAVHFITPSGIDLDDVHTHYEGTIGSNTLLTISDGCTGVSYPS